MPVIAFKSQSAFEAWLAAQGATTKGLWLKVAKKSSGIESVSRQEAVDAALCHGWIDGQLDSFDDNHWLIRFTPRQPTSKWSEKNRARALELIELGRICPAGLKEIERAKADGRWERAYEAQGTARVPDDLAAALASSRKAKGFFETLNSKNRYAILYRVHDAKRPSTRVARIEKFVAMLEEGRTIYPQAVVAAKARPAKRR
ncbi:YdeI family protein [Bradyrhizobium sp.]|uniref:YdeI/OmpD-associated family protein n=1 Tax=Bradyrhizobium sp. TaxID=376 RepID=UPI0025BAF656|nr:YdeI/OmpD-associated family protein [Bradyrhizobium sp.]